MGPHRRGTATTPSPPSAPSGPSARRTRSAVLVAAPLAALLAGLLTGPPAAAAPAPAPLPAGALAPDLELRAAPATGALLVDERTDRLAPGLVLEQRAELTAAGPVRSRVLRLAPGSTTRPRLLQDGLSAPREPAALAAAGGAVAAVNGDFFDIDRTGSPNGPVVRDGTALKAAAFPQAVTSLDGALADLLLRGTATVAGRPYPLAGLNPGQVGPDAVAVYTPDWGRGDRAFAAAGGVELEVRDGRVSAVRSAPGAVPVPAGGQVLLATGTAAAALAGTPVGAPASTAWDVRDVPPGDALGARLVLVRDGRVAAVDTADPLWSTPRARTAVGWTAAGELLLVTADGGTARSRGWTALETARALVDLGARTAVMLDGGGSAQLVARAPGTGAAAVVGEPSDGAPRPVANAVGLVPAPGDGRTAELRLVTGPSGWSPDADDPGQALRLFPGLAREVRALALDASGAPAGAPAPVWTSSDPGTAAVAPGPAGPAGPVGPVGPVAGTAALRGGAPGTARVRASLQEVGGEREVLVLGRLAGLSLITDAADGSGAEVPVLPAAGDSADVVVLGRDAEGRAAPVDAREVAVRTDPAVLRAEALPDGRLRLSAVAVPAAGGTRVGLAAAGVSASAGVSVGLRAVRVDDLADAGRWSAAGTRADVTAAAVPATGLAGAGGALRLSWDVTGQPAGTSVAALVPAAPLRLPAGAREVALDVRADGRGGWLRAVLRVDGAERPVTLAPALDWTGWRRVSAPVPAGARDVRLVRVHVAQTDVTRRTSGALDVARLDAAAAAPPPAAADPAAATGRVDPALETAQPLAGGPAPVAVLAGTAVEAARPASVEVLRRAVADAVAAGAGRVVLAGDVAGPAGGRAGAADVRAVRDVLERSGARWEWVRGNSELGADLGPGAGARRVDDAGTRWLLLDAAGGSLRAADPGQLAWLRAELDAAAGDAAVRGLVVVSAHGPGSLADPDEAALLRGWLAGWREETGGRVAVVAGGAPGASTAGAQRREGVLEVTAAGGTGAPGTPPAWTSLVVDAAAASRPSAGSAAVPGRDDGWLRVATRPVLDSAAAGDLALAPGARAALAVNGTAAGGGAVRVPAAAARVSGPGLVVRPAAPDGRRVARAGTLAVLDPRTLEVTGVSPGTTTLRVEAGRAVTTLRLRVG
ncbi:phosphodiester glycosidase family protein [Kineococcus terrestris]|uniref:phosphodiester glycosidase family protein n=1 Tax=Kineococcus terrestris TaxID=2044856 RepID=UPI0034DB316D